MVVLGSPDDAILNNYIYYAAKSVRAALWNQDQCMQWPPDAGVTKEENVLVPHM